MIEVKQLADLLEETEPFQFSKFGTREWEVQLWSMVAAANSDNEGGENAAYCARLADEFVLELRKRL